jgi:hypothetical protein
MSGDEKEVSRRDFTVIWRNIIVLLVLGAGAFIALLSLLFFMQDTVIVDLGYRHFASIFGLPAAAAASLLIVLVTRAVSGPMSVEFFGLKFQGAASETVMWVICFLAIAYAIERTWPLQYIRPDTALHGQMS